MTRLTDEELIVLDATANLLRRNVQPAPDFGLCALGRVLEKAATELRSHRARELSADQQAELNGHIEIAEQCCDWIAHEMMDRGDPTGKLADFVRSIGHVLSRLTGGGE